MPDDAFLHTVSNFMICLVVEFEWVVGGEDGHVGG